MTYTPSPIHLRRYADLLVNHALGGGKGISPGDVVAVSAREDASPLYSELCQAVWRAGGHVISRYQPGNDPAAKFFAEADGAQLDFFPAAFLRGFIDQIDHLIHVFSERDPHAMSGADPAKVLRYQRSRRPFIEWQDAKESAGKFSWTGALYGTEGMAAEAGLTIEEYWGQIIAACFLDDPDPNARWHEVSREIRRRVDWLNALAIDRVHVVGEDVDLWITLGEQRVWLGCDGRNVPSFEIYTSPDWRGTEGWIRFSEPLYIYGSLITGIELEFSQGRVVKALSTDNEALLKEMVATEGADALGEFSLTDSRLSRITRFMADTLFNENMGGPFGNTHVALGHSLSEAYDGDWSSLVDDERDRLGFNRSSIHTDIVSTTDRTVTAVLRDGTERVIYRGGRFID